jgi:hypothetical protein
MPDTNGITRYTFEVHPMACGSGWYAQMFDEEGHVIHEAAGKHGPLDALSNAAIRASNREYDENKERKKV